MMNETRYPELDALRGVAVLLMVSYHLAFDLQYFYGWPVLRSLGEGGNIPVEEGIWKILARAAATVFLLLIGICFAISWERTRRQLAVGSWPLALRHCYSKYLRRGLVIFAGGMIISLATWFIAPDAFVKFGVLHLIGISTLLLPFFTPLKQWNLLFVLLVLFVFFVLPKQTSSPFFFPLGLTIPTFSSLDYFPLLPWFGVILFGMVLGNALYVPERHAMLTRLSFLPAPRSAMVQRAWRGVGWTGRRSLWIYFVHQPVLLLLLGLVFGMPMK